ncbi:MAG: hypothetical protein V3T81_05990 [Thermoanaerobaculia bacterium]
MAHSLPALLAALEEGRREGVYLVSGDRVLAEPAALEIGEKLAESAGCEIEVYRRPAELAPLLADLKTFPLFGSAKVIVAVETAVVADQKAAADLLDEAAEVLPLAGDPSNLSTRERRAAGLLLQALRLFRVDRSADSAEALLGRLPDWALQGGAAHRRKQRRTRGRRQVEQLRAQLGALLEAAWEAGLEGVPESELTELAEILERGLPEGHALVLAESTVDSEHPLVQALAARQAFVEAGRVEAAKRGGWKGLELLAAELEKETGAPIRPEALTELARRTLQHKGRRGGGGGSVEGDSTERLAAEYRKLATISAGQAIDLRLVERSVEDRGQEDVWKILDAIGSGSADEALQRLRRLMAASEDPTATRLAFFALLAGFGRQLAAIGGLMRDVPAPAGERNYSRFKSRIAPALQRELAGGRRNPLAGLHPYRLHRAYLTACRMSPAKLDSLPARILEAELRIKGESGQPEAVLAELVTELALAVR